MRTKSEWYTKEEAGLLFFDPTGDSRTRDPERTGETAETAAFWRLHAGSPGGELVDRRWEWGSRGLPSARTAARQRFAMRFSVVRKKPKLPQLVPV